MYSTRNKFLSKLMLWMIACIYILSMATDTAYAGVEIIGKFTLDGRTLKYNGRSIISYGNDSKPATNEGFYQNIAANGFNHKFIVVMTAKDRDPNLYKGKDLRNGFDESTWDLVRKNAEWARKYNIAISFKFWSTPILESGPRRWESHLWNSINGGPISNSSQGKGAFFGASSGPAWEEQVKLVRKYISTLRDLDNVIFIPMYEADDYYGSNVNDIRNWYRRITDIIRSEKPNAPVGVVFGGVSDIGQHPLASEVDIIFFEGPFLDYLGASRDISNSFGYLNKPLAWHFIYPSDIDADKAMWEGWKEKVYPASQFGAGGTQNDTARAIRKEMDKVDGSDDGGGGPSNQPPQANAGSDQIIQLGDPVTLDGSASYDPDGTITKYSWDLDDGNTKEGRIITHTYLNIGTYTVTLTVTDDKGATDTDTAIVTVNAQTSADLSGDGKVEVIDLGILLSNWGKTTKPPSDLNQDGKVDIIDLGILLSNWG